MTLRPGGPRASAPSAATAHAPRSRKQPVTCPNCTESFTPTAPPKGNRVTRYLPSTARFVSWIELRGGSASVSAISRKFNLAAAERDILLGRYCGAGDGIITHRLSGRGGGRVFTLVRKPRPPTMPSL